jgi:hypothetical protein
VLTADSHPRGIGIGAPGYPNKPWPFTPDAHCVLHVCRSMPGARLTRHHEQQLRGTPLEAFEERMHRFKKAGIKVQHDKMRLIIWVDNPGAFEVLQYGPDRELAEEWWG